MSDDGPVPDEGLLNLRKQLREIEEFVKTSAYRSYQRTYAVDIEQVENNILGNSPIDEPSRVFSLQLFAERDALRKAQSFFEDAQATLKNSIAELEDADTKVPDNNES